jgi:hypothetical protein
LAMRCYNIYKIETLKMPLLAFDNRQINHND